MKEVIVYNIEKLCEEVQFSINDIYIYGAKLIGKRIDRCLENCWIYSQRYVVSEKYDNPDFVNKKMVYRIEKYRHKYKCLILSVNSNIIWEVREELLMYDIEKLIIISPFFKYGGRIIQQIVY